MVYYSPEEIAKEYNVQPGTVRAWMRDGRLKAIKMGGLWRVKDEDLQEFIRRDKKESADRMFNQWVENGKNEEG